MSDDAFIILARIVIGLAIVIAAWALLADWLRQRFRRRRRCPRCWYDMSHSPTLTCSECGYTAKKERRLFKARRRWRWAFVAVFLLIGSHALHVTAQVKQRGWVAAVPTTVIILVTPWLEVDPELALQPYRIPTDGSGSSSELLYYELIVHRIRRFRLPRWQQNLLGWRCLNGDQNRRALTGNWFAFYDPILEELLCATDGDKSRWWYGEALRTVAIDIETRPEWPADVPIYGRVRIVTPVVCEMRRYSARLSPITPGLEELIIQNPPKSDMAAFGNLLTVLEDLGTPDAASRCLEYDVTIQLMEEVNGHSPCVVREYRYALPMQLQELPETQVTPCSSQELDASLARWVKPVLALQDDGSRRLYLATSGPTEPIIVEHLSKATLGVSIELLHDNAVVARAEGLWPIYLVEAGIWPFVPAGGQAFMQLSQADGWPPRPDTSEAWFVRVRGEPAIALRDIEATRCWEGEITLPLRIMSEAEFRRWEWVDE
jgi:hypothetical protein